jgi:hypothetical protein
MQALTFLLGVFLAAGCAPRPAGGDEPAQAAGWRLTYRLSGGIAGFEVTFSVAADGTARYERARPRSETREARIAPAEVAELERLIRTSGFLDLPEKIEPKVAVNDAFLYQFVWADRGRVKRTSASDGSDMPEAFLRVREAVAALERRVLAEGGPDRGGGS